MSVYLFLKIFALVVLLSPLLLILVGMLCMFLPAAAELLSKIFWEYLGSLDIFSLASQVLQTALNQNGFSGSSYSFWIISLLFESMLEALVLGCCVYLVKITHMRFSRKYEVIYSRPIWLLTLAGVIIGVVVCHHLDRLAQMMRLLLSLGLYFGCFLYGLYLMFRSVTHGNTYRNRKWGFFGNLLLEIFCNMVNAVSGVFIVTCVLEGPRYIQAGGSIRVWLTWIGVSVAVMYIMHLVAAVLKPKKV